MASKLQRERAFDQSSEPKEFPNHVESWGADPTHAGSGRGQGHCEQNLAGKARLSLSAPPKHPKCNQSFFQPKSFFCLTEQQKKTCSDGTSWVSEKQLAPPTPPKSSVSLHTASLTVRVQEGGSQTYVHIIWEPTRKYLLNFKVPLNPLSLLKSFKSLQPHKMGILLSPSISDNSNEFW